MKHKVDLTGDYRTTVYASARRLLAEGAAPGDTIEIYRRGQLSMSAAIGVAAKLTVRESDEGNPSLRQVIWEPFPSGRVRTPVAKKPLGRYIPALSYG